MGQVNDEALTTLQGMGQRMAARRKQLGMTQEQVAELSGLSNQFFACVERGMKNIRAESLLRVCKALDVSADYLLTGQVTDVDRLQIVELVRPLKDKQLHCLEEIIRQYVTAVADEENG